MATGKNFLLSQFAKRGMRSAGGIVRKGFGGARGRVANALEMQQARRRQAERGLSNVGAEEFESKNYERIAEKERQRLRAKLRTEYDSIRKVHKADLDVIKKNINRVISENKSRIIIDPIVMDLLSINVLKKITELRKSGELPKPPNAQNTIDYYISDTLVDLKRKLSFVRGRNSSALMLEINSEIANSVNENFKS